MFGKSQYATYSEKYNALSEGKIIMNEVRVYLLDNRSELFVQLLMLYQKYIIKYLIFLDDADV